MSQTESLLGKAAVLEGLPGHPAIKAIVDWNSNALTDAKVDRNELTLTIASGLIRGAALAVQAAGYNFFEDMTAVDWFPASPRFQLSYHILSHAHKEHIRLRVMVDEADPIRRFHHAGLAVSQFLRARGFRSVWHSF